MPRSSHQGVGTGFIWDEQGYLVTNYHVIAGASAADITFDDGTVRKARWVRYAKEWDLAVLYVDPAGLRFQKIELGESGNLQVGQYAFAIGNPFGLKQSLSHGVISALSREINSKAGTVIEGVIQTTAEINPGNSGGPLLDSSGRLIGVNTAIASTTGSWVGVGFAIPIDRVNEVVTDLINGRR
jgi:S1-C subfamily serine protease